MPRGKRHFPILTHCHTAILSKLQGYSHNECSSCNNRHQKPIHVPRMSWLVLLSMCPLSPIFIYNLLNVIIYLMLTWLTQTSSCHMFYQQHPLYADLAHPYLSFFLHILRIYADLYHPDPSYVQIFTYVCRLDSHIHLSLSQYRIYADLDHQDPLVCSEF